TRPYPNTVEGTTPSTTTTRAGGGGEGDAAAGKEVFASSGCGSCHTLADAGASGQVGPNLDDLRPDFATVRSQVENGGGGMPAFGGDLSSDEIDAVARFVSENAGQ
ncbi:MAG TPA: cytochrome c, partial [Conexibacter sp.]